MEKKTCAGVVVFVRDGVCFKYLLIKSRHGHWEFPKGKIEESESLKQAAIREVKEEVEMSVVPIEGFEAVTEYFYQLGSRSIDKKVYFFVGQAPSLAVSLSDEHEAYEWLDFNNAIERLSFESSREILDLADTFIRESW